MKSLSNKADALQTYYFQEKLQLKDNLIHLSSLVLIYKDITITDQLKSPGTAKRYQYNNLHQYSSILVYYFSFNSRLNIAPSCDFQEMHLFG